MDIIVFWRVIDIVIVPASILEMFPLADIPPAQPVESDLEKKVDRLGRVHQNMIIQSAKPGSSSAFVRPGEKYRRYHSEEDIPEKGRLLFKLAGMTNL